MESPLRIHEALFATQAIRFAPPDQPFWYTSGMIGPYYVNTQFLCGGEQTATALLARIETLTAGDRLALMPQLAAELMQVYADDAIYRAVIDALLADARTIGAELISGGERRDFFFSIPVAVLARVPHVSIFKDGTCVANDPGTPTGRWLTTTKTHPPLPGAHVLHIADIITQAASFTRAWIPALRGLGAATITAMAVLDRLQDGRENLQRQAVTLHVLAAMDDALFARAHANGVLTTAQWDLIRRFNQDPRQYMEHFFATHPHFLAEQLAAGGQAKERAQLCIRNGFAAPPPGWQ